MGMQEVSREEAAGISVIIPSYNSGEWLPSTLRALEIALVKTPWDAEIIIVDDGSSDNTTEVLAEISKNFLFPLQVIKQVNQGRFLARLHGAQRAKHKTLLLLDSRVPIDNDSLLFVHKNSPQGLNSLAWNGHVTTDPSAALIGHFWEVPTYLFWGTYLSSPRRTAITTSNFNKVPKGTGLFICPTKLFIEASLEHSPSVNAALTSDDTKIIRTICEQATLVIDPLFSATYRPRTTVWAFIKHTFARGTFFVDSFAGVTSKGNLIVLMMGVIPTILMIAFFAAIIFGYSVASALLILGILVILTIPPLLALRNHCPLKGIFSYFVFALLFGLPYWAGVNRGLWVHRRSLFRTKVRRSR